MTTGSLTPASGGQPSTLAEVKDALARWRGQKKIVFTNGCFDILHVGHVRYLAQARALGELLVVGVNADASVRRLKGPARPIQCEQDRLQILLSLKSVDYAFLFSEDTPENAIREIAPDILVKGGDWPIEKIVGADFVLTRGGVVRSLDFVPGRSSSAIIEKIIKI